MSDWKAAMKKPDKTCNHVWEVAGGALSKDGKKSTTWYICRKCWGEREDD